MNDRAETFDFVSNISGKDDKSCIIWLFNIGVEKYWNITYSGVAATKEDEVINNAEEMMLLLSRNQDIVIMRRKPQEAYLNMLRQRGFGTPQILCPQYENDSKCISELVLADAGILECLKEIGKRENVFFFPYGVSKFEERIAEVCNLKLIGGSEKKSREINDKIYARKIAQELGFPVSDGYECRTIEDMIAAYNTLSERYSRIIIKTPYNASGKGMWIVDSEKRFKTVCMIITRFIRSNSDVVWLVEGWIDKMMDMNCQIFVTEDGRVEVFSIKEQVMEGTVYMGSIFPPRMTSAQYESCYQSAKKIGQFLYEHSFHGIFGIDGLIAVDGAIIPIIEINGRCTLSTYISFLTGCFANKQFYSFYKRSYTRKTIDYEIIVSELKKRGVYADKQKSGLFLYTSETLNTQIIGNVVRFFCVACGNTMEEVLYLKEKFDMICSELEIEKL